MKLELKHHDYDFQVRRYRAEVSSLQTSLNRARVERMTSSLGASSEARQSNTAGTGGGPVTDQYRQQVGASSVDLYITYRIKSAALVLV